tara:strand:+ start:2880 stop:3458 length:579 start_codon:yes stop_codon:yes gene_type:complete
MDIRSALLKLLGPDDQIGLDLKGHCLVINADSNKEPLISAFLQKKVGIFKKSFAPRSECDITVTEIEVINSDTNNIRIGNKSRVRAGEEQSQNTTKSNMKVLENKWAMIEMNDSRVDIKCQKRGDFFELDVRVGSEGSFLSNSVQVSAGQEIDLGSIVKEINEKNKELSTTTGIQVNKKIGTKQNTFKLSIR